MIFLRHDFGFVGNAVSVPAVGNAVSVSAHDLVGDRGVGVGMVLMP